MTEDEAVLLTRYVRAMCPQQRFDEFTADAWFDILAPYCLDEARTAVARHIAAGNSFVSVGEIAAGIRRTRDERLQRHTEAEPPRGDTGDAAYPMALAAERRAVADGCVEPVPVSALPSGENAPYDNRARTLLRLVGKGAPSRRPELTAPCPYCAAPAGRPCTSGKGRPRRDAHPNRVEASRRQAAGAAAPTRAEVAAEVEHRRAAARAHLDRLTPGDRARLTEFRQQRGDGTTVPVW
ncbi:hypothetical protein ACFQLX_14105 [Streptomyces polyrhachis]|uniref:DNA-binding phage zinc finger domain-containing protein n=1 Tax=Streptomyces polyrhachis TaxID=1282885 RepID=A0ABW2GF11_9ACTN